MSITKKVNPVGGKASSYTVWSILFLIVLAIIFLFKMVIDDDKIGYVDSAKILNEYRSSVQAKKEFEEKVKAWQENLGTLNEEVKKAMQDYNKEFATMSSNEKNMARQLISVKQNQAESYQRGIQENAKQEETKLMSGVVNQINGFLKRYGKDNNFKIILISNQTGTIAYARDGLDITEDVINKLNNEYAAAK